MEMGAENIGASVQPPASNPGIETPSSNGSRDIETRAIFERPQFNQDPQVNSRSNIPIRPGSGRVVGYQVNPGSSGTNNTDVPIAITAGLCIVYVDHHQPNPRSSDSSDYASIHQSHFNISSMLAENSDVGSAASLSDGSQASIKSSY